MPNDTSRQDIQHQNPAIQILREEFKAKSQGRSNYSLRSFAKDLGISPTVLSLVLSGKRALSRKAATLIANRLQLLPERAATLLQSRESRSQHVLKKDLNWLNDKYESLDLEVFRSIFDWIHYAILSLVSVEQAKADYAWVARKLKIEISVAQESVERLKKLGLIVEEKCTWKRTKKAIKVDNSVSTELTRNFQRQIISKGLESLDHDPIEMRSFTSTTIAIDPQHIPYARERIRQFRRELTEELERMGSPTEVYNLAVQIYPVTKKDQT